MNCNRAFTNHNSIAQNDLNSNKNDDKHRNEDSYSKKQMQKQEKKLNQVETYNVTYPSDDKRLIDNSPTIFTVKIHSILQKDNFNDIKKDITENDTNKKTMSDVSFSLDHNLDVNDIQQPLQKDIPPKTESISIKKDNVHSSSICHNCKTDTTPLWGRNKNGNTLCNACGLFLKLHGTSRPINLKTNVIKSRNRKSNSHNKNCVVNKILKLNFQSNHPFWNNSNDNFCKSLSKQYMRDLEILSSRDFDSVKRFKTSLTRDQNFNKLGPASLIKTTKSIKPLLRPKPIQSEIENYFNSRRLLYPSKFEKKSSKSNSLSIPSLPEYNFENSKSVLANKNLTTSDHHIKNNTNHKPENCGFLESDMEFQKHLISTHNSNFSLSEHLSNEENMIKLQIRIQELELVTDLYRNYIFRMEEKCQNLEALLRSTYN